MAKASGKVLDPKRGMFLVILCAVMYSIVYIGRYPFAANVSPIGNAFGFADGNNTALGLVLTMQSIAYGSGQLLHGFFARKYNPKYIVPVILFLSAAMNVAVGLCRAFAPIKFLWMVNGAAQSFAWCCLINAESRFLSAKDLRKAVIANSTTYLCGYTVTYGLSALFIGIATWRVIFYVAGALLALMSVVWFLSYRGLERALETHGVTDEETLPLSKTSEEQTPVSAAGEKPRLFTPWFLFIFAFIAVLAAAKGASDQGFGSWMPKILGKFFGIGESYSVLFSVIPAIVTFFSVLLIMRIKRALPKCNLLLFAGVCYAVGTVFLALVSAFYSVNLVLFLVLIALFKLSVGGVASIITSQIPFSLRKYGNSGGLSAMLDAFVYVGEAASMTGFAAIADGFGWSAVLYVCTGVLALGALSGIVGGLFARRNPMTRDL